MQNTERNRSKSVLLTMIRDNGQYRIKAVNICKNISTMYDNNMREKLCINHSTERNTKNNKMHLINNMGSSKIYFAENANISKEEIISNEIALYNAPTIRNVPNILRSSNTRAYRNYKMLTLDKTDISFTSSGKDTSFDLNSTLSSIDSEKEDKSNLIILPKSHHQRKQVHNPLDIRYDIPDWNNNQDPHTKNDHTNMLNGSSKSKEDSRIKKLRYNRKHKNNEYTSLFNKKSRKVAIKKSDSKTKRLSKKLDFDLEPSDVSEINIKVDMDKQIVNSFSNNNVLTQPISESHTSDYINGLNDIETSDDLLNIFCCNNDICNDICSDTNYDINSNAVMSARSTKFNQMQYKSVRKDISNCEFLKAANNVEDNLIGRNSSNFSFASNVLYTCTCENCTSTCDQDIVTYDDTISNYDPISDMETEMSTPYKYDFYTHDYYHILGDALLTNFDDDKFCFKEIEEIKENSCYDNNNITQLNEHNTNGLPIEQNNSENSQSCHINRVHDICIESYPKEFDTHSNKPTKSHKYTEDVQTLGLKVSSEKILSGEDNTALQYQEPIQTSNFCSVPISKSKRQMYKNNDDLCVIQCAPCGRLFNEEHHFRKHFTHCNFYKEDFKCSICNKIYKYKSSLVQHLKTVHHVSYGEHEKFYICQKCSKLYVRFRAFQRHVLLHDSTW